MFHEPINPRGINFDMCVEATRDAGYEKVANELEKLKDEETWVEYALHHIEAVREEAKVYDNIEIHTWPDRRLINAVDGEKKRELLQEKNRVSPEKF